MDIISTAVCGVDSKAFEQDGLSYFEEMAGKMRFKFGGVMLLKFVIIVISKRLANWMGFNFFDMDAQDFFLNLVKASLEERQRNPDVRRNDFMQLMIEAREGLIKLDEDELDSFEKEARIKEREELGGGKGDLLDDVGIAGNTVLFLMAGSETTQCLLSFCSYCLALNPEIQERLREEIEKHLDSEGEIGYDELHRIEYLDMVINETLRLYPPAGMTDRFCTKDYTFPDTDLKMKSGSGGIVISIWGLHHDPEYYPEPEKFNPERFSCENRGNMIPYTFMPFGLGPRNCIGFRFAMTEAKLAIIHIVQNFRIEPSKRTVISGMKFKNENILKPTDGMHLSFTKIR